MAKAKQTGQRVEVIGQQGLAKSTFANPDGSFTDETTQTPTRAKAADGSLVSIDTTLALSRGRLTPKATNSKVSIRATASIDTKLATADVANLDLPGAANITMGFGAALPVPVVTGDTATYALSPTAVLTASAMDDGFSENVVLSAAPATAPTYRFPLTVAGGLTPKLEDGVLTFTDADGNVVASSRPLIAWDAHRDGGEDPDHVSTLDAALTKDESGWELTLKPSMKYLTDPSTQYPVVVDPTVVTTNNSDTWYYPGNTVLHANDYYLRVGASGTNKVRTYLNWVTGPFTGKAVTGATMSLYQYEASSCSGQPTEVHPTLSLSNPNANLVAVDLDPAWASTSTFNTGGAGCSSSPNGYVTLDVGKQVSAWVTGEEPQYAMELRAGDETDANQQKRFCSEEAAPSGTGHCEGTTGVPKLSVTYRDELGIQSSYKMVDHKLNDRSQLSINARNGNAVLKASDVHLNGRGLDLNIDRFYNSLISGEDSQFGPGWSMSVGPDVYLKRGSSWFDYIAPGRTQYGRFVRYSDLPSPNPDNLTTDDFHTPNFGGSNVDMHDNGSGIMKMTFHQTQEKYYFDNFGCNTCDRLLTKTVDRNNNTINYNYTNKKLTSITDTHGRTVDINRGTNGYISSITERSAYSSSPRTWTYHYNSANHLDYYVDPTGARTDYGYTNDLLTSIQAAVRPDGKQPTTTLTYSNGQVTQTDYQIDSSGNTKRFTWDINADLSDAQDACNTDDNWDSFTTVTNVSDPQGGATKYCYKNRETNPNPTDPNKQTDNSAKFRTVDGLGHRRSTSFTPNMDSSTGTGQSNEGTTDGSTVFTYNTNNTLTKATQPKDTSGDTAGSTSFDYPTSNGSVAGGKFLPTSTATTASSCSSSSYDSRGNLTDSYTGMAGTSSNGTCSGSTSGKHSHVSYNNDGTPSSAYGPEAASSSSLTPSDKTQYFYFSTEPNAGELSKVVKPGGNSSCTTDRTGCTTYTYDSYSRVASTTDGNSKTTTYTYDKNDRITQVLTDSATTCTYSAGSCITYTFDNEGNLTSRVDRNGTTSFGYDWLNRQTSQTQPSGLVISSTFDGAGNLTTYAQTVPGTATDTVTYSYDAANQLQTVTDATGTFNYTYNNDGRPTKLELPVTGVSIGYSYTKSGKVKTINPAGGTSLPSYTYDYNDGTDEDSRLHKVTTGGVDTVYHYNDDDQVKDATPTSGTTYSYTYDDDGNIRSAKAGSTTTYYGYNENDQLCWSGPNDSAAAAMALTCATTPSGDTTYTSDKAGNNLGTSTGPISYNAQGQVDQISSPSGAGPVAMTYLDQGNNIRLSAGNDTFAGGGKLGTTARTTSYGTTFYTRDNNGQILNEHGYGGTYFYLLDRLGSTMALIDTNGAKAGSYTYDPYGKTTATAGTSATAAANNPWRYTGGYQDPIDGYYKFGARYYDAAGHFTSADSIAGNITRPEKYNSYTYTAGDPINNTDLSGTNLGGDFGSNAGAVAAGAIAGVTICAASIGVGCVIGGAILGSALSAGGAYAGTRIGGGSTAEAQGAARNSAITGLFFGAIGGPVGGLVAKGARAAAAQ
ncbi:DNRLRE domain-containing protein [uncultured Friedmanniella sp.]|uniref:DNRLRE domain-containing protein n=1 Tax=uncultured Friedmanniella sp. TaxID=335381 RepID=UPI0035CC717D